MDRIYKIIAFACLLVFAVGCGKEEDSRIPSWPVNVKISLTVHNDLRTPGKWVTFTLDKPHLIGDLLGYSGLLAVCSPYLVDGTSVNDLYVYDLCCPYEARRESVVTPMDNGTAQCKTCGNIYDLINDPGANLSGVPEYRLKRYYNISYFGTEGGFFKVVN